MRLGTCLECVGSSPRVSGACQDSIREFAKRRSRLSGRLSGVVEKLIGNRQEHIERSLEEDRETHRRECQRLSDCGNEVVSLVAQRNRETTSLRLEFPANQAGGVEKLDLQFFVHSEVYREAVSSLHVLPYG
ncbi:hypothetical protein BHE74_00045470 [Ensete ventricosum]|nr:hypothetical protein BHE74_00045470 [Ensete ventricosum]